MEGRKEGRKWRIKSVINYKVCDNDDGADEEESAVKVLRKGRVRRR
jgi:hypothetical protein